MSSAINDRLLDLIYDAAGEPALLDDALRGLCELTHSDAALIEGFSHRHEYSSFHHSVGLDPNLKAIHEAYYMRNPWADYMIHQPVGRVVTSEEVISIDKLEKTAFHADIILPQKLGHSTMAVLAARPDFVVGYHSMRTVRHGGHDERDIETMREFIPHLRRSLDLRLRVENYAALARAELDALDLLNNGVVLLSDTRRVVFMNRSAEKITSATNSILRMTSERGITGGSPDEASRFRTLVEDVLSGGAGSIVRLSGPDERWLIVSVAPLRSRTSMQLSAVGLNRPSVALFITDPSRPRSPTSDFLCDQYGLTPTEAKVALAIGSGAALADVAGAFEISVNTLKTHLRRVYQKTGMRGQPELVQLMSALTPMNVSLDGPN